jgi:hypothetical protein
MQTSECITQESNGVLCGKRNGVTTLCIEKAKGMVTQRPDDSMKNSRAS